MSLFMKKNRRHMPQPSRKPHKSQRGCVLLRIPISRLPAFFRKSKGVKNIRVKMMDTYWICPLILAFMTRMTLGIPNKKIRKSPRTHLFGKRRSQSLWYSELVCMH
jgi:hypothetical protein